MKQKSTTQLRSLIFMVVAHICYQRCRQNPRKLAKIILEWPVFIYCKLPVCIPVRVYFSRNNTINCFCKFKCLVSEDKETLSLRDFNGFTHEGQCFSPVLRSGYVVTSPEIQLENKQVGGWSSMCFQFQSSDCETTLIRHKSKREQKQGQLRKV